MTLLDLRDPARRHAPDLGAVGPAVASVAIPTWRARMINEHRSAAVFEALAGQLERAGLDPADVERCRTFADEERLHGVLCGAVVEALGGEARAPCPPDASLPAHADVGPREAALRNLLSICCLSETIAVALIGLEREQMPESSLRDLLTRIWADECGHASFGWRRLPLLLPDGEADRSRIGAYLAVALAHLEAHELAHFPRTPPPAGGEVLGLCGADEARALFEATVHEVILPGLEAHGLPARSAWKARGPARERLEAETRSRVEDVRRAALG